MSLRDLTLFTQFIETSSNPNERLVPCLDLPLPKTIEFCAKLPSEDNHSQMLPLATMEKSIANIRGLKAFTWAVSNYLPHNVKQSYDEFVQACLPPAETITELDRLIENPTPLLIADMGGLGFGLFAKSKILKGTPVCTYMGKLIPSDRGTIEEANIYYTVGVRTSSTLTAVFQVDTASEESNSSITIDRDQLFPAFIDGYERGNYGSFLQHLPSDEAIAGEKDKADIATANLITVGADYRYYPCYYFRAARDIEANEILGFDYGENFWKAKSMPLIYFDRYGKPLR